MTRMKLFYIDKNGECYRSTEFNGNGYCNHPDDNGWIGLQELIKFIPGDNEDDLLSSFKEMIANFNKKTYEYPDDELDYFITTNISGAELFDRIKNSCTDYIYIRNDGPEIHTESGVVKTGITVFNFTTIYNSVSIEQCIKSCYPLKDE